MCCIIFLRSNPLLNCLWKWFQFGCKDMILFWVYGAVLFCVAIYLCNKNFIPKSYLLIVSIFSSLSIFSWLVLGKPVNNNNRKTFFSCGASTSCRVMTSLYGASRSHPLDTQYTVGLFWTSAQPVAENSSWQHTTPKTDSHPCPLGDSNPEV